MGRCGLRTYPQPSPQDTGGASGVGIGSGASAGDRSAGAGTGCGGGAGSGAGEEVSVVVTWFSGHITKSIQLTLMFELIHGQSVVFAAGMR